MLDKLLYILSGLKRSGDTVWGSASLNESMKRLWSDGIKPKALVGGKTNGGVIEMYSCPFGLVNLSDMVALWEREQRSAAASEVPLIPIQDKM